MKFPRAGAAERVPLMTLSHLDAAYVDDPATFARSWIRGGAIVEGAGTPGVLDHEHIWQFWGDLATRVPLLRQRLTPVPFALTAPVWVTLSSVNLDDHLRFHPTVEPDQPSRIAELIGREIPGMDLSWPLWEVLVVPFDSGRVGFLTAVHHVMGDAQAIYPLVESVSFGAPRTEGGAVGGVTGRIRPNDSEPHRLWAQTADAPRIGAATAGAHEPGAPIADAPRIGAATAGEEAALREAADAPPSGAAVLATLAAQWWSRQDSVRGAIRAYRRSNTRERLGLWRDRIVWRARQQRAQRAAQRAASPGAGLYCVLDVPRVEQRAEHLGVSVSDLLVAATLRATGEVAASRTQGQAARGSSADLTTARRITADATARGSSADLTTAHGGATDATARGSSADLTTARRITADATDRGSSADLTTARGGATDATARGGGADAATRVRGTGAAASLLVAIAGGRGTATTANNRVWTPTVTVGPHLSFEETALDVRRQIREALHTVPNPAPAAASRREETTASEFPAATPRREEAPTATPGPGESTVSEFPAATPRREEAPTAAPTGYATFIELPVADLTIAGGRSTDFVVWPGGDAKDLVNCVAIALGDRLTVTVTTGTGVDPAHALDTICSLLAP